VLSIWLLSQMLVCGQKLFLKLVSGELAFTIASGDK
jgi:hypothetical protein